MTDDPLGVFLRFADNLQETHKQARLPAISEICPCGGSLQVSADVPAAERRRIWTQFVGRHNGCTQ